MSLIIDTNNQFRCVRKVFTDDARLDYVKYVELIEAKFGTQETKVALIAKFDSTAIRFSDRLRALGFKTILKEPKERRTRSGPWKHVDYVVDLTIQIFTLSCEGPLILGSADYRLEPLLRTLRHEKIHVASINVPKTFEPLTMSVTEITEECLQNAATKP